MKDAWTLALNAATDAVMKTIQNNFDFLKTAKELFDKYENQ